MKQSNLEIITTQKDQHLSHGTPHGELGLGTLENLPKHLSPDQVAQLTASWQDLLHTPIKTIEQRNYIEAATERMSAPVTVKWLMGRIATLQAQYYTSALPEQFQEAIADDWYHELRDYPAWAIAKAVRWWMSSENDKRRYKPVSGDISERARLEMGILKVAKSAVRRFDASVK